MLFGAGELSVEEFKRMRNGSLDGVELLALSACDTANGDIRASAADGGEFESFALLAQLKGADAVLASLWPVNDTSTSLLMGEFYRLRKTHPEWTKLEALRQAQIELLQGKVSGAAKTPDRAGVATGNPLLKNMPAWTGAGFSHPFYWAPFELIGNWK
jgi:CHAT domain-containing protein